MLYPLLNRRGICVEGDAFVVQRQTRAAAPKIARILVALLPRAHSVSSASFLLRALVQSAAALIVRQTFLCSRSSANLARSVCSSRSLCGVEFVIWVFPDLFPGYVACSVTLIRLFTGRWGRPKPAKTSRPAKREPAGGWKVRSQKRGTKGLREALLSHSL
jgi:hypothetical protein